MRLADEAYRQGDYLTASTYYGRLVNDVPKNKAEHIEKYARALYKNHAYADASQWFEILYQVDTLKKFPDTKFWWAITTKQNSKYKEARKLFEEYLKEGGNNKELSEKASIEIKACADAVVMINNPLRVKIEHLNNERSSFL